MKICKVEITKKFNGGVCHNVYPVGYNANKINVVAYDENPLSDGDNTGYCIGTVGDDFSFTDKMVEVTKTEADTFIDARADVETDTERKTKFKTNRKKILTDAGL